ncbi:Hypothetical protein CINCED_3A011068 [Cinara cedri]|uniref:Dystroglycan 1 n=1 Tax=Cinara cedri TaxID=506608 RepID=A0A5E4MRM3_9HEMI|nr:Hypothetical protein CINCED_3A011068 [Cinara cedri]
MMKGFFTIFSLWLCLTFAHKSGDVKHKWWSIPEPVATVGKLFYFKISHDSVVDNTGPIDFVGQDGGGLPSWLVQSLPGIGELEGIPGPEDVRDRLLVRAGDKSRRLPISNVAYIRVAPLKWKNVRNNKKCGSNQDSILLCLVIGMNFKSIQPLQRLIALKNLAGFLNLPQDAVLLVPQESVSSWLIDFLKSSERQSHKNHQFNDTSFVLWEVGCGGDIWPEHMDHVRQMQSNAVDGTLSEVLQLPVTSWRLVNSLNPLRGRRQLTGAKYDKSSSTNSESDDTKNTIKDNESDDDVDDDEEIIPDTRQTLVEPSPVFIFDQYATDRLHRHHRRDESILVIPKDIMINTEPVQSTNLSPTFDSNGVIGSYENIQPTPIFFEPKSSILSNHDLGQSVDMSPITLPGENISTYDESVTLETEKLKDITEVSISTSIVSSINGINPNMPPIIKQKLPKLPITAGKPLRYPIPNNVFYDPEDGDVKHLTLTMLNTDPSLLSWVEFDAEKQILLALPLEDHVSKWEVVFEAKDSGKLTVNNTLELVVQQLHHLRAINHQLTLQMRLKPDSLAWTRPVNWSLDIIDKISAIYETNIKDITVLDWPRTSMLATNKDRPSILFTWTNDTLPRDICPKEQIMSILEVLKPEKSSKMKSTKLFGSSVVLEDFSWQGLGNCASTLPRPNQNNFTPVLRNPVDLINATYGQLLTYVVPEDTFYDPEDGSSRRLKLSLMTIDRTQVPTNSWLQFDAKNQEFYGIPLWGDKNFSEYQLICTDKGGNSYHDSLVVTIHNSTKPLPSAEFDIIFKTPEFKEFNNSAKLKKTFIERVAKLFKDENTSNIVVLGIGSVNGMTMVTWYNKTLEIDRCDEDKILHLRQVCVI